MKWHEYVVRTTKYLIETVIFHIYRVFHEELQWCISEPTRYRFKSIASAQNHVRSITTVKNPLRRPKMNLSKRCTE